MASIDRIRDALREKIPAMTSSANRKSASVRGTKKNDGEKVKNVGENVSINDQLSRLGQLSGLSVKKFADANPANKNVFEATKEAVKTLSANPVIDATSYKVRKGFPGRNATRIPSLSNPASKNLLPLKSNDDEIMKALLKSSLPKIASTESTAVIQRKLLYEKMKAEKANERTEGRRKGLPKPGSNIPGGLTFAKQPVENPIQSFVTPESFQVKQELWEKDNTEAIFNGNVKKRKINSNKISPVTNVKQEKDYSVTSACVEPIKKKQRASHSEKRTDVNMYKNQIISILSEDDEPSEHIRNIKKEKTDVPSEAITSRAYLQHTKEIHIVKKESNDDVFNEPNQNETVLTVDQVNILECEFIKKDSLSRKEMHQLAKKTGLLDVQVRDWFKARRIEEEVPTIINEVTIDQNPLTHPSKVKEEHTIDNTSVTETSIDNTINQPNIKTEPSDDEPLSSVLDPLTGRLMKKSKVDEKMEEILSKASVLDSLAKKMELVNNPTHDLDPKDKLKDQVSNIIEILDDDIQITSENIVNPGPKVNPLGKVLNKFLNQVEILEKSMDVNELSKSLEVESIRKENSRKEDKLKYINGELTEKIKEISVLERELNDKNEEIENILFNSVSKETFVRTKFQNLTSEVKKMNEEKRMEKSLKEKIRELEHLIKEKDDKNGDLKDNIESLQNILDRREKDIKDLHGTSTKMIGDITKGIGEKLAASKKKEEELKNTLLRNDCLEIDLKNLANTFKSQNEELLRIKEEGGKKTKDLSDKLCVLEKTLEEKEEEVDKLETQTKIITQRFRTKVKDVQETLHTYNETLKRKNEEIDGKCNENLELQSCVEAQGSIIAKLKCDNKEQDERITDMEQTVEELKTTLSSQLEEANVKNPKPTADGSGEDNCPNNTTNVDSEARTSEEKDYIKTCSPRKCREELSTIEKSEINDTLKKTITTEGLGFLIIEDERLKVLSSLPKSGNNKRSFDDLEREIIFTKKPRITFNDNFKDNFIKNQNTSLFPRSFLAPRKYEIVIPRNMRQQSLPMMCQQSLPMMCQQSLPMLTYNWPLVPHTSNKILLILLTRLDSLSLLKDDIEK